MLTSWTLLLCVSPFLVEIKSMIPPAPGVGMSFEFHLPSMADEATGSPLDNLLDSSSRCKADAKEKWSYRGSNGPMYWKDRYPICAGREQSPIAIQNHQLVPDEKLSKLKMVNYDRPVTDATILNNGHTVQITPTDGVKRTIDVNGETYELVQLHFHWGNAYYKGSEHIVNGMQYSMELHFVHMNSENQLAVVGVLFQEQTIMTQELQKITKYFPLVLYKDMEYEMKSDLNLEKLLPENPSSFYRYAGSLTTPNCAEGVTWSLLTRPLPVGGNQMKEFRRLYSATKADATEKCKISDNYRPVQPLNHRKVYLSQ